MVELNNTEFAKFDDNNPEIWELFVRFTFELIDAGRTRNSARGIFHRIRWESAQTSDDALYKLNDAWSPYYARKFHAVYPEHEGFFQLRTSRADEKTEDAIVD